MVKLHIDVPFYKLIDYSIKKLLRKIKRHSIYSRNALSTAIVVENNLQKFSLKSECFYLDLI